MMGLTSCPRKSTVVNPENIFPRESSGAILPSQLRFVALIIPNAIPVIISPAMSDVISGAMERMKMPAPSMMKKNRFVFISLRYPDTFICPSAPTVPKSPGIDIRAPIISAEVMPFSSSTNGSFVGTEKKSTMSVNVAT